MVRGRTAISAMVIGLSIAACGGGGSPAPTKEAFIAAMDAKCKAVKDAAKARPASTTLDERMQRLQASIDDNLALQIQLRKAKPPKGDEAAVKKVLNEFDAIAKDAEALISATRANDMKAVTAAVDSLTKLQATAKADASAYGFKQCGV
jgi:hypothetical protein